MEHQASAKFEGGSGMIARALNERLTEEGLKRIIAKNSGYSRRQIDRLQPDQLGKYIGRGPPSRLAKSKTHARNGKKAKRGAHRKTIKAAMLTKPRQNYWARVKKELYILICTDAKKYDALRRQFTRKGGSQTAVVHTVAVGIGSYFGIGVAVVMPLVATGFLMVLTLGINAYCAMQGNV